jgi:membrane protease YdiL (CAAX protease family)
MTGTILNNSSDSSSSLLAPHRLPNPPLASDTPAPGLESEARVEPAAAPPAARPVPGFWESLGWTAAYFVAAQIIPFVVLGFWAAVSGGGVQMIAANFLPALFCGQVLGVALAIFALRLRLGRTWLSAINVRRPALAPCLLAVLCLPAVMVVGGMATQFVEHALDVREPSQQLVAEGNAQYGLWFTLLVIAVGAAVNEELFCRGFLGRGLVGRYGVPFGVLFTSFIFALLHGNLPQGAFAFVLGCFMHLAYLATRSLWVPILLHFLNNALVVVLSYLYSRLGSTIEQTAPGASGLPGWAGLAIGLVILAVSLLPAWGLYRLRDRRVAVA